PHKRRTRSYHGRHRHRILSLARHGQVGVMTPVASPRRNLHACWSLAQEVTCAPNHRSLHVRRLLRARRERPRRRAAEQHDELASDYSITSSERACNIGGMSKFMALAV